MWQQYDKVTRKQHERQNNPNMQVNPFLDRRGSLIQIPIWEEFCWNIAHAHVIMGRFWEMVSLRMEKKMITISKSRGKHGITPLNHYWPLRFPFRKSVHTQNCPAKTLGAARCFQNTKCNKTYYLGRGRAMVGVARTKAEQEHMGDVCKHSGLTEFVLCWPVDSKFEFRLVRNLKVQWHWLYKTRTQSHNIYKKHFTNTFASKQLRNQIWHQTFVNTKRHNSVNNNAHDKSIQNKMHRDLEILPHQHTSFSNFSRPARSIFHIQITKISRMTKKKRARLNRKYTVIIEKYMYCPAKMLFYNLLSSAKSSFDTVCIASSNLLNEPRFSKRTSTFCFLVCSEKQFHQGHEISSTSSHSGQIPKWQI